MCFKLKQRVYFRVEVHGLGGNRHTHTHTHTPAPFPHDAAQRWRIPLWPSPPEQVMQETSVQKVTKVTGDVA